MLYYHASPTPGIEILEPRVSNHGTPRAGKVIPQDFAANADHPEYQAFLRAKFPALL